VSAPAVHRSSGRQRGTALHTPVLALPAAAGVSSGGDDPDQRPELADLTVERLRAARVADNAGRRALIEDVVVSHLWLADAVARRFRGRGEDVEDLRQIARFGLVEACNRFDPEQGAFAAFAFPTMTGLVKRHFRDHGWSVRPSRPTQELSAEMWRRWPEIAQTVSGEPTDRQLADVLCVPLDDVRRARRATQAYTCSSLDVQTQDREADDTYSERCDARVLVATALKGLEDAERRLLLMRFFEDRSKTEIATLLGTNQMQVSRMLVRLLKKLRGLIGSLDGPAESSRAA
jgi:RNA polymerase sigma-B factor